MAPLLLPDRAMRGGRTVPPRRYHRRMAYPKNAPHPKLIGDRTTAMVLARLLEVYESVLIPFGENSRYDLLIESDEGFIRVQCKTGRLKRGVVTFNACSTTYHHPNRRDGQPTRHDYRGQADVFGVYCPETRGVYLVPVHEVGTVGGSLRIDPTANGQSRGIRWAGDYEIGRRNGCSEAKILSMPG